MVLVARGLGMKRCDIKELETAIKPDLSSLFPDLGRMWQAALFKIPVVWEWEPGERRKPALLCPVGYPSPPEPTSCSVWQIPSASPALRRAKAGCYIWPGGAVPVKPDAIVLCEADSWSQWGRLVLAAATL